MRNVLIDAGPLIALFAVDDKHHAYFDHLVSDLSKTGLRLLTTWPCIVEASYLLGIPQRYEMLEYTESKKREMDFADASLYWLAIEMGTVEIMTIDYNDFHRYRLPDGKTFQVL